RCRPAPSRRSGNRGGSLPPAARRPAPALPPARRPGPGSRCSPGSPAARAGAPARWCRSVRPGCRAGAGAPRPVAPAAAPGWWCRWTRCAPGPSRTPPWRTDTGSARSPPVPASAGWRPAPRPCRGRSRRCGGVRSSWPASVAEVVELQRDAEVGLAQQRDGVLQVVALLAVDPQLVAVDLAVDLELGVLERGLDLLGRLALDALLDGDLLPRAGQVGLHVAELQAADVDAARGQPLLEDVGHLLELEVAGCGLRHHVVFQREFGVHALEVETGGQLAAGLVDRIGQLMGVDFGDDVERGHGGLRQ